MNNDLDFEPRFFNPRNDVAFKKIFGNHLHLTKSFLNSTLRLTGERRIKTIDFIPTEQLPLRAESKKSILDVLCIDEKGSQYIIEVQNKLMANYIQRAQYYAARLYGGQLDAGDNYLALRPVTLLSLLNHAIFPHDVKYLSFHHNIERETQDSYLNEMSYAFVELPKFEKTVDHLETAEDHWIFMMKEATHAREAPEKAPEEVKEAYAILERHTWTRPECLAYEQAKIGLMDDMDSIQTAKDEGIEEGKEEGIKEGLEKTARAMMPQGLSYEMISTVTGLSVKEIENL